MTGTLAVRIDAARGAATLAVAFDAPLPGITALHGPSGAGKSSVLAAIAGLWRPGSARIALGDTVLQDGQHFLPPEARGIATVFQDSRLFPHLDVAGNLRFGARRAPAPRSGDGRTDARFDAVVALLGIELLLGRRVAALSGGERQRVAIGRALLARPRLLLMDEPLASLDAPRRAAILPALRRLHRATGVPILYVTHAADEVAALADTLVLLEAGRVRASGPVEQVSAAASLPLARRRDAGAVLRGRVLAHDEADGLTAVACGGATLLLPRLEGARPGASLRLRIAAREVALSREAPANISVGNILPATVAALAEPDGAERTVALALADGIPLLARVTLDAVRRLALAPGAPVHALVKSTAIDVLAIDDGEDRG